VVHVVVFKHALFHKPISENLFSEREVLLISDTAIRLRFNQGKTYTARFRHRFYPLLTDSDSDMPTVVILEFRQLSMMHPHDVVRANTLRLYFDSKERFLIFASLGITQGCFAHSGTLPASEN
jgi:hypothetical protein